MSTHLGARLATALLGWLSAVCLLSACAPAPSAPLKVGINPWVGYDPLVLARERGLLDTQQVQVVELASASESKRAMRSGQLDAAALTLDEALRLADGGLALTIVAVLDESRGADALLVRPDITSLAQLRGQRLAFEDTSLGNLMLDSVLHAAGLEPAEVSTIHAEASQHVDVLNSGRADAVITFEPMKSLLQAKGMVSLYDSTQAPGQILDVLVARADLPTERTAALLVGWERGRQALQADPLGAAQQLARGVDLSAQQYVATLQGLRFLALAESPALLSGQPARLSTMAAPAVNKLKQLGLINTTTDWRYLLDPRPAQLALRALAERPQPP